MWIPPERNLDNIQYESLRKQIDKKYNDLHDELSDAFYNRKPFRGKLLNKEEFDRLHGLIFDLHFLEFHEKNLEQPESERIQVEKYNIDSDGGNRYEKIRSKVLSADPQELGILKNEML